MDWGNKAKYLNQLRELGIRVPDYVVLDKNFFIETLKECGVYNEAQLVIVKSAWICDLFHNISAGIRHTPMSSKMMNQITKLTDSLRFPVAVRSSSSVEDASVKSCAGLFYTKLNVDRRDLFVELRNVIMSLYNDTCMITLDNQNYHPDSYYMGVIIQEMIHSDWSGVAFSADPITGDTDSIMVEMLQGYGEDLVSGLKKSKQYIFHKGEDIPSDCEIGEHRMKELCSIIIRLENHFGYAVDVEWAVEKDILYILQCRPITVKNEKKELEQYHWFSMAELGENYDLLSGLKERYSKWMKKAKFYQMCRDKGIRTNQWYLLALSKRNLPDIKFEDLLNDYESEYIIYHLNNKYMSHCYKNDLPEIVHKFLEVYADKQYCVSVRECLPNVVSAISNININNTIQIECVFGKMGVLNNGIVAPSLYLVSMQGNIMSSRENIQEIYRFDEAIMDVVKTGQYATATLPTHIIEDISRKTILFHKEFGTCSIEWWIWNDKAYAADMSVLKTNIDTKEGRVISVGETKGILRSFPRLDPETMTNLNMFSAISVQDTDFDVSKVEAFQKLSEVISEWEKEGPVILYSELPYIYLTPFVKMVDGFIFENASTLCHLSLIIREAQVPAISLLGEELSEHLGKMVMLRAKEGIVKII